MARNSSWSEYLAAQRHADALAAVQRFADIWNAGRSYNFRLWRYHPRLRNAA